MNDLIVRHFDEDEDGFELIKTANGAMLDVHLPNVGNGAIRCSYSDLIQIKDAINSYLIARSVQ